jgi:hypothetical protein
MDSNDTPSMEFQPLDDDTRRRIDLVVETQIRIIAGSYEKANAYTNLIIVAGYAGLFALWQLTRDLLSRTQVLTAALLILTSIIIFVLFEIYKAHYTSRLLRRYLRVVQQPENRVSPERLLSAMNTFEAAERAAAIHFVRFWQLVFWLTTVTGVSAALVLGYAFARGLLRM